MTADSDQLEKAIVSLLSTRADGATICPSEVARAVGGADWRELMEPVREAARRLVARGQIEITQHGAVVDPDTARGPIRLRRVNPDLPPSSGAGDPTSRLRSPNRAPHPPAITGTRR